MNDQKKMLIDSMRKLISHVSSNKQHQIEIYCSLTKGDLIKILTNLEDHNPTLRKMSIKLICELLYKNPPLKEQFGELMGIRPVNGHIVINKIPQAFAKRPEKLLEAMDLIKSKNQSLQLATKSLGWFINPNNTQLKFELIESREQEFVDPKDNIVGISISCQPNASKSIHESVVLELRASLKDHRPRTSITSADTDRYSRAIKDIRVKREEDQLNMSREDYKLKPKQTVKQEERVRTDGSEHFRYRPIRVPNSNNTGSPQSVTLRTIDKTLRQKRNQKQSSSFMETPGHMSDRVERDSEFNSKPKNNFTSQIKNSYAVRDANTTRETKKQQIPSHRESYDSNYKPAQIFSKKYKQEQRRLY